MQEDRRNFLKGILLGGAGLSLGGGILARHLLSRPPVSVSRSVLRDASPIQPVTDLGSQTRFGGDQPEQAHKFLWQKDEAIHRMGGLPEPTEQADVVVIGGGVAGMMVTEELAHLHPILIEQAPRLGGNSRGESLGSLQYSQGAAYLTRPEPSGELDTYLRGLGLMQESREITDLSSEVILKKGKWWREFWSRGDFKRLHARLVEINQTAFPDIPLQSGSDLKLEKLHEWDRMSFDYWVMNELGEIEENLKEYLQLYFWSSFGAGPDEVSAAQGLSFLASDLVDGFLVFPGGNAAIAQKIYERLKHKIDPDRLRVNSLVFDIRKRKRNRIQISYFRQGTLMSLEAKQVVVCAPKFVCAKVLEGIPSEQLEAMQKIRYRSYVVGQILLKGEYPAPAYDVFALNGQAGDPKRIFCDLIFSNWAEQGPGPRKAKTRQEASFTGLTLYRPYAFDGGRQELYAEGAFEKCRAEFEGVLPELFHHLGLKESDRLDFRLTRWGHPLPVPSIGYLDQGVFQKAHQPLWGRLCFANQDNWGNACFESSRLEALVAARWIKKNRHL